MAWWTLVSARRTSQPGHPGDAGYGRQVVPVKTSTSGGEVHVVVRTYPEGHRATGTGVLSASLGLGTVTLIAVALSTESVLAGAVAVVMLLLTLHTLYALSHEIDLCRERCQSCRLPFMHNLRQKWVSDAIEDVCIKCPRCSAPVVIYRPPLSVAWVP